MALDLHQTHPNLIDGAPRAARDGGRFQVADEAWSRSGPSDVADALASLRRGSPGWFRKAAAWAGEGTTAPGPGIAVVRRSWCEGAAGLRASVEGELAAGRAVLVLADGHAPALAEGVVRKLEGVPADAVALLFDDGDVALRAAALAPEVERVVLSGHEGDAARLMTLTERARVAGGFGVGVLELPGREVFFHELGPSERGVELGDDPEAAAREVLRDALGRDETLSGQLAGQVGRVRVHSRQMSRFTSTLLAALEDGGAVDPPLGPVEADLPAFLEAAYGLGLDEGATLIHEHRVGSPRAGSGGRIARLVFTNVEPSMRLWGLARPAPLLLLSRRND